MTKEISIIGAGLSGLSTSYHLDHSNCRIYEAKPYFGGHVYSYEKEGFTWDEGPHISFTKDEYVRSLLEESVSGDYQEFAPRISNYYRGDWIDHPAQTNLYQVPEPLRSKCLKSFHEARQLDSEELPPPKDYSEWIARAFGEVFARNFPAAYTRKYWTTEAANLDVDWIGQRVFYPSIEEVEKGYRGEIDENPHYFKSFRYPSRGGYLAYAAILARGSSVEFSRELRKINFAKRRIEFSDGSELIYGDLVSTIPLPTLIEASEDAPDSVRQAADQLRCSRLLLINVAADHPTAQDYHWLYVYDEDKLSTRITLMEQLSPHNAPESCSGIQVEVYGSDYNELPEDWNEVEVRVIEELVEMGLLQNRDSVISSHTHYVPWANVIFDLNRQGALSEINDFLDRQGIVRVGRYAEWKYYWTDDCILSGRRAAHILQGTSTAQEIT